MLVNRLTNFLMFADVCLLCFLDNFYKIVQVKPIQVKTHKKVLELFPLWSSFMSNEDYYLHVFIRFSLRNHY